MNLKEVMKDMNSSYSAGTFGALLSGFAVWGASHSGLLSRMNVAIAPSWTFAWLLPRLIAGGLWGLVFVLPFLKSRSLFERAILISLAPTLFQLLYVFPMQSGAGFFGFQLGSLTPVFVFASNLLWALATALWFKICR